MDKLDKIIFAIAPLPILFSAIMIVATMMSVSTSNPALSNYYNSIENDAYCGLIISAGAFIWLIVFLAESSYKKHSYKK
ncbi:MAG: hypothetical protein QXX01_03315 [Candidatus Aenigmatarchaeota archaeon]